MWLRLATPIALLTGCQVVAGYSDFEGAGGAAATSGGPAASTGAGTPSPASTSAGGHGVTSAASGTGGSGPASSSGAGGDATGSTAAGEGGDASSSTGMGGDGGAPPDTTSTTISTGTGAPVGPFPLCEDAEPRRWELGAPSLLSMSGELWGVAARDGRAMIVFRDAVMRSTTLDRDGVVTSQVLGWDGPVQWLTALPDGRFAGLAWVDYPLLLVFDATGQLIDTIDIDAFSPLSGLLATEDALLAVDSERRWVAAIDVDESTVGPWKPWGPGGDFATASFLADDGIGLALGHGDGEPRGQRFDGHGDPIGDPVASPDSWGATDGWSCGPSCWVAVPISQPLVRGWVDEDLRFDATVPNQLWPKYNGSSGFVVDGCHVVFQAYHSNELRNALVEASLDGSWMVERLAQDYFDDSQAYAQRTLAPMEAGRTLLVETVASTITWRWLLADGGEGGSTSSAVSSSGSGGSGGAGGQGGAGPGGGGADPGQGGAGPGQEPYDGPPQSCIQDGTWLELEGVPDTPGWATAVVPLDDGRVLIVNEVGSSGLGPEMLTVDVYDPVLDAWAPIALEPPPAPRSRATFTELADGTILAAGGIAQTYLDSVEIWDLDAGTTRTSAPMPEPQVSHFAGRLLDGRVVVAGGQKNAPTAVFEPAGEAWQSGDYVQIGMSPGGTTYGSSVLVAGAFGLHRSDGDGWVRAVFGQIGGALVASLEERVGIAVQGKGLAVWHPGDLGLQFMPGVTPAEGFISLVPVCDGFVIFTTGGAYRVDLGGTSTPLDLPVAALQAVRLPSGEIFATGVNDPERRAFLFGAP